MRNYKITTKHKMRWVYLFLILSLFPIASATICSPNSLTYNTGDPLTTTLNCTSFDTNYTTPILLFTGEYISLSSNTLNSQDSKSFTITYNPPVSDGLYNNPIYFSDGSTIPVTLNIATQSNPSDCRLNPSLASMTQLVQQGNQFSLDKITFSPINCVGSIFFDASNIYMSGGIITDNIRKPVSISSISQDGVNLMINTEGLSSQTYPTHLNVNAFGKIFDIPITIIVTGSSSIPSNFSYNNLPTCSLNSLSLNLNSTYSLICNNIQPDIVISPRADNDYIEGVGIERSSNQYSWNFKATKLGSTTIYADFLFANAPIGKTFSQEVKITTSGTDIIGGINLKFSYYQNGMKKEKKDLLAGSITVLVLDNKTDSVIPGFNLYINGVVHNNSLELETGNSYELRATALGYLDLVEILTPTMSNIEIILNPNKGEYEVGESINLTSNPANASFLLDDIVIGSPYTFNQAGNFILKAVLEGYKNSIRNLTVINSVFITTMSLELEDWGIGDDILVQLNGNISWKVEKDGTVISSGNSDMVNFTIKDIGTYTIKTGTSDYSLLTKYMEKRSFWARWQWFFYVFAIIVVLYIIYLAVKSKPSEDVPLTFKERGGNDESVLG